MDGPLRSRLAPAFGVFAILWCSYAFYWQSRDWNSASRLMLTYALADRGTFAIDGLANQTGDKAFFEGHYYSDKLPGFSLLAVPPYLAAKLFLGLPAHPLDIAALAYWPADYWVTLGTSGLCTALAGALLTAVAIGLGCGPRRAAIVGLSYGLATPAYAYATLSYGHQATACALLASFLLIEHLPASGRPQASAFVAGLLAALAAVIELQVGPVAAILGCYLLAIVLAGTARPGTIAAFAVGAVLPTIALLAYNTVAFGSPWDMGYFHHAVGRFRTVHSAQNPLGLAAPAWHRAWPLLGGDYRGLLCHAPVVALAVPGWIILCARGKWGMALVSLAACVTVFLINLSYPEWTGGWSTGPRFLLPMLPFAMLPVAALLATGCRCATLLGCAAAAAGVIVMSMYLGIGARVPEALGDHVLAHPLIREVWPLWNGQELHPWATNGRFARNLVSVAWPTGVAAWSPSRQWLQFVPLWAAQIAAIGILLGWRPRREVQPISREPALIQPPAGSPTSS